MTRDELLKIKPIKFSLKTKVRNMMIKIELKKIYLRLKLARKFNHTRIIVKPIYLDNEMILKENGFDVQRLYYSGNFIINF